MSKLLYACLRQRSRGELDELKSRIVAGASRVQPSGVKVKPPRLISDDRIVAGISTPSTTNLVSGTSVCIGCIVESSRWQEVGTRGPEGAYAICRCNGRTLELLSDAVGSRTLWYYIDDSMFVASTSQRWLACVLGRFVPNRRAITWMLVTGCLGPTDSWDSRVHRLPPDSTFSLDLDRWTARLTCADNAFMTERVDAAAMRERFRGTLREAFEGLDFDYSKWVLPLSGGYDSRGILCMLERKEALRSITWGMEAAMANSASDAAVARRLASSLGVSHEYFHTDLATNSLDDVLDMFVANGEGRTDHISGYLDGFSIWRTLANRGIEGVIRGDEGFGWTRVSSCYEARKSVGLLLWSDFGNLPNLEELDLVPQEIPESLHHRKGETPSQWRDRLYHGFRIPTILAGLTDLKASYVEISNPLLSHSIIRLVRGLPDSMRTEKRLFREMVDEIGPGIPYAREAAIADPRNVLSARETVEIFLDNLGSEAARAIFPSLLLDCISARVASRAAAAGGGSLSRDMRSRLLGSIPGPLRPALRRLRRHQKMDFNAMALRVCITCKTHALLNADASVSGSTRPGKVLTG